MQLSSTTGCALRADRSARCWGSDVWGGLQAPAGSWRQIGADFYHFCGLRDDDSVECWGCRGDGITDTWCRWGAPVEYR